MQISLLVRGCITISVLLSLLERINGAHQWLLLIVILLTMKKAMVVTALDYELFIDVLPTAKTICTINLTSSFKFQLKQLYWRRSKVQKIVLHYDTTSRNRIFGDCFNNKLQCEWSILKTLVLYLWRPSSGHFLDLWYISKVGFGSRWP